MGSANFVFHGLFPDVINDDSSKPVAKVLFDVEFEGQFHSHLLAEIELVEEQGEAMFEVRRDLPFECDAFAEAAVQYYQYIMGGQKSKISHSGPKGASILTHNVVRAEWPVQLQASPFSRVTN